MPLDRDAAIALAGPDVTDLATALDVEAVTGEQVTQAHKAAEQAEQRAAESEQAALEGKVVPAQASADREAARFARLRAHVTARRAERHAQAERLKALHQVGADAVAHAGKLPELAAADAADDKIIAEAQARKQERAQGWTGDLADIAAHGDALSPAPVPPGGRPVESSAHVWAGTIDGRPVVNVNGRVISGIRLDHPDGLAAAIGAADRDTGKHDPAERLYVAPNGLVQPVGRDAGGHIGRALAAGQLRELTLDEKRAYWRGEQVSP